MKLILLILLLGLLSSCNERNVNTNDSYIYDVIVIDSCEYIYGHNNKLAHKGNCSNEYHKRNKEIK